MHAFYKPRLPDEILQLSAKMVHAASDVIIILLASLIVFIGLESAALCESVITSSLRGRAACDGKDITLTCVVRGAGRLTWVTLDQIINYTIILVLYAPFESLSVTQNDFTGLFFTHSSPDSLTSTLQTRVNSSTTHYPVTIFCNDRITISIPFHIRLAGLTKPFVFYYVCY